MPIHESESVKYLFDHIRSVWTLSAGGLAAGVALFAYIIKESQVFNAVTILLGVGCVLGLMLYAYSIWNGVTSQTILIEEVRKSETATVVVSTISSDVIDRYKRGRRTFFWGCIAIVLAALIFLLVNAWAVKYRSNTVSIPATNAMTTTMGSRRIEVKDLRIELADSDTLTPLSNKVIQVKDLTFTINISENH